MKMFENLSSRTKKSLLFCAAVVPVVSMVISAFFWFDTRYMHRNVSNTRFIDTQMLIIEGHIEDYDRMKSMGGELSPQDERKYEMKMIQLQELIRERNKLLGIGE